MKFTSEGYIKVVA